MRDKTRFKIVRIEFLTPDRANENDAITGYGDVEALFVAQHREGGFVGRIRNHRKIDNVSFAALERGAVATQNQMALHDFFSDFLG